MRPALSQLIIGLLATAATAAQAETVTVTVAGVHSAKGQVYGQLCENAASFPTGPCPYQAFAPAKAGDVVLKFENVKPGNYAFSGFHDEDGDHKPTLPLEGTAFGGGQSFPADFNKAAMKVAGDTAARETMIYIFGPGAKPPSGNGVPAPAGVVKTDIRDHGLYAELYAPAGAKNLPVIIAFGGSEGGLDTFSSMSVGLSQKGYVLLVLAYWRAPGLPDGIENIPLEYFKTAIDWVKARPEADPKRIGMIGWSRGGEAALLVAAHYPEVKAVCAIAPSGNIWSGFNPAGGFDKPAWTLRGKPLPMTAIAPADYAGATSNTVMFQRALARGAAMPGNTIPVEKINGPVLLLSGDADQIWPSSQMSEQVVARLKANHFAYPVTHLAYAGAGHGVFIGGTVDTGAWATMRSFFGGTAAADSAAWADDWPRTVQFFGDALKGKAR
ncbi:MAG: hypothetical protein JWM33_2925 [Caulobacteraceae bacterium]|nr:hypothetical protein [Caulobacteraceae bacterium]